MSQYNNSVYYGIIYPTSYSDYILEALKSSTKYSDLMLGECVLQGVTLESSNNGHYGYIYCPNMCFWGGMYGSAEQAVARFNPNTLIKIEGQHPDACAVIGEIYTYMILYLKDIIDDPHVYISWFSLVCSIESVDTPKDKI